jgi:UDP-N-acetylglucosamine 2-epimerase (non-hydrolysing)
MAPVIRELERRRRDRALESVVCVTGQHREMLRQVLTLFAIEPRYNLDVMTANQTPTQVASAVLREMETVLKRERPDMVLVQGDTTTVAAASLAAFYGGVAVGHVEAGLRTFNRSEPFPEEINRRVAGVLASVHFAPTASARDNLLAEGVPRDTVFVTGNTVIDALHEVANMPAPEELRSVLTALGLTWLAGDPNPPRIILVTAHRRENLGAPLENICHALRDVVENYRGGVRVVYPVHLNPNVRSVVHRILGEVPNVLLLPPLDYLPLVHLMRLSHLVVTDSGGIQEEAPTFGRPVLVLRDVTERPEAVEAGTVRLVGSTRERVRREIRRLLDDQREYDRMARAINPYGDGLAAGRIVGHLLGESVDAFVPLSSPAQTTSTMRLATDAGAQRHIVHAMAGQPGAGQ